MGEVEGLLKYQLACIVALRVQALAHLSLGQLRLDSRPSLTLSGVTEQVHDDSTLGDSLIDLEQVLARDPAILLCFFP